ncbi:hypothetical protein V8C86DRAFT_3132404 [Haematococcus lacustris]
MRRSTQLLDLPEELLGAVLRQLDDGDDCCQVFRANKHLAKTLVQYTPFIQLTHPLTADSEVDTGDERLQQLSLGWGYWDFTPHLAPLAPHLTQLAVDSVTSGCSRFVASPASLAAAVGTLTCLQSLEFGINGVEAGDWFSTLLAPVLASLPSLHTLLLQEKVAGDQLDVLLAATQITHLQVYSISCLALSRVSAACSWRQLEVEEMDWLSAAHLPLHSLTHPLHLALLGGVDSVGAEVLAAAELNLCERNKAGLEVEDVWLSRDSFDLLTKQHVSRNRPAAQQLPKPTVTSNSSGQEGSEGSAAGGQAPMQRLGSCVKKVVLWSGLGGKEVLTLANLQAFSALFPRASLELRHARS